MMDSITALGRLLVSGPDAAAFLQGQVTSDVQDLKVDGIGTGALCNPKGRVIANFLILRSERGFELFMARDLVESVAQHLKKYVLRSKVEIYPELKGVIGFAAGSDARSGLSHLGYTLPHNLGATTSKGVTILCYAANPELFLLVDPDGLLTVAEASDDALFFRYEVERGYPWITEKTREMFLPQMLDLERFGGISYKKGCYTGQEIVTRTHFLGQLKRGLYLGRVTLPSDAKEGDLIYSERPNCPESVGALINVASNGDGSLQCLVVLQNDQALSDALHLRAADGPRIDGVRTPP